MSIKNYSILTKRYKLALSTVHMVYRLVNSTYDLKELLMRLAKLISQIFNAPFSQITILDPVKKHCIMKVIVSPRKKIVIDKKCKFSNGVEGKVIRTGEATLKDTTLATPLVSEDVHGVVVIKRRRGNKAFDHFDQELLMSICEQAVTAIRNLELLGDQQKIILGSIKSLVMLLDKKCPGFILTAGFSAILL
jgi:hypothetical protein